MKGVDVNSVLGLLHHVVVGDGANVSDVHASSFRIKGSTLKLEAAYNL
jgi:hypothetical protein